MTNLPAWNYNSVWIGCVNDIGDENIELFFSMNYFFSGIVTVLIFFALWDIWWADRKITECKPFHPFRANLVSDKV